MTPETTDELRSEQYRSYLLVLARINLRTWGPVAHKVDASNVVQEALLQARTRGGVSFRHTAAKAGLCPIMPGFWGFFVFFVFLCVGVRGWVAEWFLGNGWWGGSWFRGGVLSGFARFFRYLDGTGGLRGSTVSRP